MLIRVAEPILSAGGYLAGQRLTPDIDPVVTEAIRLHVLGFKGRTILKGAKMWPGVGKLGLEIKEGELRKLLAAWDERHPDFVRWRASVHKRAKTERFVTNPYGRRAYHLSPEHAQAFMVLSTAQDALRAALGQFRDAKIQWITFGSARLGGLPESPQSAPDTITLTIGA